MPFEELPIVVDEEYDIQKALAELSDGIKERFDALGRFSGSFVEQLETGDVLTNASYFNFLYQGVETIGIEGWNRGARYEFVYPSPVRVNFPSRFDFQDYDNRIFFVSRRNKLTDILGGERGWKRRFKLVLESNNAKSFNSFGSRRKRIGYTGPGGFKRYQYQDYINGKWETSTDQTTQTYTRNVRGVDVQARVIEFDNFIPKSEYWRNVNPLPNQRYYDQSTGVIFESIIREEFELQGDETTREQEEFFYDLGSGGDYIWQESEDQTSPYDFPEEGSVAQWGNNVYVFKTDPEDGLKRYVWDGFRHYNGRYPKSDSPVIVDPTLSSTSGTYVDAGKLPFEDGDMLSELEPDVIDFWGQMEKGDEINAETFNQIYRAIQYLDTIVMSSNGTYSSEGTSNLADNIITVNYGRYNRVDDVYETETSTVADRPFSQTRGGYYFTNSSNQEQKQAGRWDYDLQPSFLLDYSADVKVYTVSTVSTKPDYSDVSHTSPAPYQEPHLLLGTTIAQNGRMVFSIGNQAEPVGSLNNQGRYGADLMDMVATVDFDFS